MRRGGHAAALLLVVCGCLLAAPSARAAQNNGGVAFLSWSPDSVQTTLPRLPADSTATLYVRLSLVREVKGFDIILRWSSSEVPPCFHWNGLRLLTAPSNCAWILSGFGNDHPLVGQTIAGPDSVRAFYSLQDAFSTCTDGILVGMDFTSCGMPDSGAFCIDGAINVIDGSNVGLDTLTVTGDARIGGGSPERPCGPPPPPRVDRIVESSVLYGENPTISIYGFNFQPVPAVRLERVGYAPITADTVTYDNASQLRAHFDLSHADFGNWVLIVQNPDGQVEPKLPDFSILVPAAQIGSLTPRVLYAGPTPGRDTVMTINGQNFYANPAPPAVRLENGFTVLTGTGTQVVSVNQLRTHFVVPDTLPQVQSPLQEDHAFALVVQNTNSAPARLLAAVYLFQPPPSITSVTVTPVAETNFVEWALSDATTGSRFTLTTDELSCGVYRRTRTVMDSVFTRGSRFHFVDEHPSIGRSNVYAVRQIYRLGGLDSITTALASEDTVGVRCGSGESGITFQRSIVRLPGYPMVVEAGSEQAGMIRLEVHDLAGRRVRVFEENASASEAVSFSWDGTREDGRAAAAGIYAVIVQVPAASGVHTERRKIAVLR